jgi:hypothetical protein
MFRKPGATAGPRLWGTLRGESTGRSVRREARGCRPGPTVDAVPEGAETLVSGHSDTPAISGSARISVTGGRSSGYTERRGAVCRVSSLLEPRAAADSGHGPRMLGCHVLVIRGRVG